ncbi:MAG TPA: tetratricopeptide repeat protein [Gemmatimonadales bacterium]|nr:tetratricopeptide repeat protein [Gemmatimonadales bacterium]
MRSLLAGSAAVALLGLAACGPGTREGALAAADTSIVSLSIAFFEARLAADPNNYPVAGRLAARYLVRFGLGADPRDAIRAEALARRLTTLAPDRAEALGRLSGVLLTRHRFAEAVAVAREAVAADSGEQDAHAALFDASLASGDYAAAEAALATLRPGTLAGLLRRAQWLDHTGHTRGARYAMERACRRLEASASPPAAVAWCRTELAGLVHQELGPEAAAAELRQALRVLPGYRGAVEQSAHLAAARGNWDAAYRMYRRIATDAHPDLYLRLAESAGRLGRAGERGEWEGRFLRVASEPDQEALFGADLAWYLARRNRPGDRAAALALARREVGRRPTGASHDLLARVHLRHGEPEAALAASDRALALGGSSPAVQYHRGLILRALGRLEESRALLAEAGKQPSLLPPHAWLEEDPEVAGPRS